MNLCCAVPRSWLHHKATFEYFWRRKSVYPPLLEELKHRCESKLEVNLPPLFECMESRKVAACILLRPKSSYDYCSVYSGMQHSHLWLCIANQPFSAYIYLPIYNPASIPGLQIPQSQIPGWSKAVQYSLEFLLVSTGADNRCGFRFWKVMFRNLTFVHVQTVFQQKLCAIQIQNFLHSTCW